MQYFATIKTMQTIIIFVVVLITFVSGASNKTFPKDFLFGIGTSAYQIEGAWNINGKSENIWDHFTHNHPHEIIGNSNGDIACNSYNKIQEDVALLKNLGVDIYRFSLSWTRILPSPLTNNINSDGIRYYNALINLLVKNGIQPMVTLYHWDLPQSLQELGGFANPLIIDSIVRYARAAFKNFGDRVKLWSVFNDPYGICFHGYGDADQPPALNRSGIADYICGHNLLKAHAEVYHMYQKEFKSKQKGNISISLNSPWFEPASKSKDDIAAADRALQFNLGWFAYPIFGKSGDYPKLMKTNVEKRSKSEGFPQSRLPKFTSAEVKRIKGTCDFFSLNHFTTYLSAHKKADPTGLPSFYKDMQVNNFPDPNWPVAANPKNAVFPWGLTKLLQWIKEQYANPEIYVTENGYSDLGILNDLERISYTSLYLNALLDAKATGVRVNAYIGWSLLDSFEWRSGYVFKYGLYQVDFNTPNRTRTAKSSVAYFKQVITNRRL